MKTTSTPNSNCELFNEFFNMLMCPFLDTTSLIRQCDNPSVTKTSRTEFGQQMRSREVPAYLSLNRLLNGILFNS